MIAIGEALIGQLHLVTIVALVVGNLGESRR
jgi:formaldehyde-activating enzyme involved in methanogenesis